MGSSVDECLREKVGGGKNEGGGRFRFLLRFLPGSAWLCLGRGIRSNQAGTSWKWKSPGYQNARSTSLMMPSYGCLQTHLPRLKSTILAISYTTNKMKSLKEDSSCSVYSFSGLCYDQAVEHRSPSVYSILFTLRREIFRLPSQSLGISTGYKTLPLSPATLLIFHLSSLLSSPPNPQPVRVILHIPSPITPQPHSTQLTSVTLHHVGAHPA